MRNLLLLLSKVKNKSLYSTCRNISFNLPSKNSSVLIAASAKLNLHERKICTTFEKRIQLSPILEKVKQKVDKKKSGKSQNVDMHELSEVINIEKFTNKMAYAIEDMKKNFVTYVSIRSTVGSIEQVGVSFEGEDYMLQELAQIVRKPKMIVLSVTTFPQAIPHILEAISKSGLNLNPQQDGTTIFIPTPKVTKEHREGLAKNAKALFIKCRDHLKDVKNKELKDLKKIPSISEDQVRRIQAQLETLCEQYVKEAEDLLNTKQQELLRSE